MTALASPPASAPLLLLLAPDELASHPGNVRADLRLDEGFIASIREHGVLEPLVVTPIPEGGYRLLMGHRRAAAALEVGLEKIPCLVREDLGGDATALESMLVENDQRSDLTVSERAAAYAQLLAFADYTSAKLAKRVGRKTVEVEQIVSVGSLPEAARTAADAGQLDLVDAANLAEAFQELSGDQKAIEKLTKDAAQSPQTVRYAIADLRLKRARSAAKTELRDALTGQGVVVTAQPKDYPWASRQASLTRLADQDGETLTPDAHRPCPGHRAFIEVAYGTDAASAVFYCEDPDSYGHQRTGITSYVSPAEVAAREAREQEKAERLDALASATTVRREFLTGLLAGKAPKGLVASLLDLIDALPYGSRLSLSGPLLDCFPAQRGPLTDAQALNALAARVYNAAEEGLRFAIGSRSALAIPYLEHLRSRGFTPSPAEEAWLTDLRHQAAEEAREDEADEGDDGDFDDEQADDA